ncbi:corrinoid methyltransferase [Synergistales bacterium]|nr:corrinoid methyltransferase [Synergistales bacterium]GHV49597.1 corrinoid methyltransferase [Synergistales bacterium]
MAILNEISEAVQQGKVKAVKELVQKAVDEKAAAKDVLDNGLLVGMSIVGEKFKNNEVFVPEVLLAARALNAGTAILKPLLIQAGVKSHGKAAIGTVKGDLHDIGKNLVKLMFEGKGIEVFDLGADVAPEKFIETVKANDCQIIACSALLTTTMAAMKDVVDAAVKAGIRDKVKIMVGGAPITQAYADQIGADGFTADAASAADLAVKLIG